MVNPDDVVSKSKIEKKVTVVDGEPAVVEKLPNGTARMVIANQTDENTEEE